MRKGAWNIKSLSSWLLVSLSLAVAAPAAARPRASWPGVSDVLLNVNVAAPVAAWPTTPVAGWPENDSERPGSVLVFPKWREGTRVTTDQGRVPNTEFEVSVKCPVLDCTTLPGYPNVTIKGHWVCQGDQGPETPGICHETDFTFNTTVNATVYLTSECLADRTTGLPAGCVNQANGRYTSIPRPPCDQFDVPPGSGNFFDNEVYLILWMVNANSQAIKWDGLTGDAILRQVPNESNAVEGYTPVPIQAGEGLATGDLTVVNGDRALDFDGTEYRMLTGQVAGTVRYQDESFVSPATKLAN